MYKVALSDCIYQIRKSLGVVGSQKELDPRFLDWAEKCLCGRVSLGSINRNLHCLIFDDEVDYTTFVLGWCGQNA